MLPAALILLPVSLSVLVVIYKVISNRSGQSVIGPKIALIYKYFRSGRKSKFSEGVEVPLNPTSVPSPAPSDLDPEILDWIRGLDPAVLNWIGNLDPAFLDVIRNFDPAFPLEFSEGVDGPLNPPSVPSPEPADLDILDFIRTLDPAVLDEIQSDPAYLDKIRNFDPSIVDDIRRLSLKEKEEKEEEKRRKCEKENEKERERESSGGGGRNENGGEVEKKVVEESSRRNQYPLRPEAGECSYYLKTGNCKFGSNCKFNHPWRRTNKQPSWEVELDALISSTSGAAGSSTAPSGPATVDPTVTARLQELLSFSAAQVLDRNGLHLIGECLNDLAAEGQLTNEAISRASSALKRTREYFGIFEKALRAEDDLKAALVVQDKLRPKIDALKAKKETSADLDRQIAELQNRRSAIASELAKDFEMGGKASLTEYAATVKRVEQLKLDKRNRQAEVTLGEVRWLELKATLEAFLPSTP